MKIANRIARTAALKTMAVTKVDVEADCAVVALTPDRPDLQATDKLVVEKTNKGRKEIRDGRKEGRIVIKGFPAEDPGVLKYPHHVPSVTQMGQFQIW